MIDLHSHILPDLDDGARTLEEALAMARIAVADGITAIAATPHSPESTMGKRYSMSLVQERLRELRAALRVAQIPLDVVSGTELFYAADLPEQLRAGTVLPYGDSHAVLLECPAGDLPPVLSDIIFGLQAAGYRVVLAHPERIRDVQRQPGVLAPLVERGALMQITAEALVGRQGDLFGRTAEALVTKGLAHILASDAHGVPPRRAPVLSEARARAAELLGSDAADAMVLDTPDALLHDRAITVRPPQPAKPTRRWKLW